MKLLTGQQVHIPRTIFKDILNPYTNEPIIAANRQAALYKRNELLEKKNKTSKREQREDQSVRSASVLLHDINWVNHEDYFTDLAEQ